MTDKIMRVKGRGTINVKPDMTRVTMAIRDVRKEYDLALKALNDSTDIIKGLLTNEGFAKEEVKTTEYEIDKYDESYRDKNGDWKTRFAGYKYCHVMKVEFESDNDRLGRILKLLSNNGSVTPEFAFSFFVKDVESAKNLMLERAVADAKAKAEILAKSAGVTLKDIVTIDYSWGEISLEIEPLLSVLPDEPSDYEDDGYAPDIEPDDIEASDTVTVIWNMD